MAEDSNLEFEPQSRAAGVPVREFWADIVRFTLLAFLIVAPIRWFVAQPFIVHGASMDPNFADGDYLIVDELSYYFKDPVRGEVIIFRFPKDKSKYFIKRVIGLPGEKVRLEDDRVFITSGKNTFELNEPYLTFRHQSTIQMKLDQDQYFVMGDNRPQSSDSRAWGPISRKHVVGKIFVRLYPFDKIGRDPGAFPTTTPKTVSL